MIEQRLETMPLIPTGHWLKRITYLDEQSETFMSHTSCWQDFDGIGKYSFTITPPPHLLDILDYNPILGIDPEKFLHEATIYKVGAIFVPYPSTEREEIEHLTLSFSLGNRVYESNA